MPRKYDQIDCPVSVEVLKKELAISDQHYHLRLWVRPTATLNGREYRFPLEQVTFKTELLGSPVLPLRNQSVRAFEEAVEEFRHRFRPTGDADTFISSTDLYKAYRAAGGPGGAPAFINRVFKTWPNFRIDSETQQAGLWGMEMIPIGELDDAPELDNE